MEIIASAVPHLHGYVGMFWQQRCVLGGNRMQSGQLSELQTAQTHTACSCVGFGKFACIGDGKAFRHSTTQSHTYHLQFTHP